MAQFNANQPEMSFDRNWSSRSPLGGSSQTTIGLLEPGNPPHAGSQNGLQKEHVDPRQPPSESATYFNPAEATNGTGVPWPAPFQSTPMAATNELQSWLYPLDRDLLSSLHMYTSSPLPTPYFSPGPAQFPSGGQFATSSNETSHIKSVPRERFFRVERCWNAQPRCSNRLQQMLWQDVVYYPMENLFSNGSASKLDPREGSSWGLDAECQRKLEAAFVTESVDLQGPNLTTTLPNSHFVPSGMKFPPAPILDIALGLFFRRLHPSLPFIHVPTFCVQTTPVSFLLVICLNGLSILGTTGATEFVARMFPVILQRTFTQLASFSVGPASTWEQLTTIATAMLTVNLAATMGNASYIAQCQMLYTALLAVAQRHGLFLSAKDCAVHDQLAAMTEPEAQWKAWSRVESLKRMICCLPVIDSWYASHLCDSPIIRSEKIQIFVPSDGALFQAKSATEWGQISREKGVSVSSISSGRLELKSDSFGASTVLAIAQNRILELYQQIIRDGYPTSQLVPWREYKHESRVNDILKITLIGTRECAPDLPKLDINGMIWWHSLCIMLLANTQIFDLAAGRHGPDPASDALDRIARWTATPDARRACVHAAQNYKLMSSRRVSEIITMHSVSALFVSALVLGLYIFMVPTTLNGPAVELTNIDVDWEDLESLELFEEGSTSSIDQTTPQQPTDSLASSVQNFVRNGGVVSLSGIPHPGGYESARRVLLDFSTLMDGTGERKSRIFSQILHIMCDDLMSVDQVK